MNCHTTNISKYVDYQKVKDIPQKSPLVTLDAKSLYSDIPKKEGIKGVNKSYEKYKKKQYLQKKSLV